MRWLEKHWYRDTRLSRLLAPLSWLYRAIVAVRRWLYDIGVRRRIHVGVPVVVAGNLTVGGSGKTPLAIWLARLLARSGYRPGIVTRGYGGRAVQWPQSVYAESDPAEVGDEPVLLARRAGCAVVADPDRVRGAAHLISRHRCDVIVSDDGLQHLRLARDIDIVVIDGVRRYGNGRCLPAGPLREPAERACAADARVVQGEARTDEWGMRLVATGFFRLGDAAPGTSAAAFGADPVHAIAGIGHPQRFFEYLRGLGLNVIPHPFPDHHRFEAADIRFPDGRAVIMTEKDAVKCRRLPASSAWYLAVEAELDPGFGRWLLQRLREVARG